MRSPSYRRQTNKAELARMAAQSPDLGYDQNVEHTLDRWALYDALYEVRTIHLGRWTNPVTRTAIRAARSVLVAAERAMRREMRDRGMFR